MAHNINTKKHHGGKVTGASQGAGPASSEMQPTPPPVRKYAGPTDVVTHPRKPENVGEGMSGGAENPSSLDPGVSLTSPMGESLKAAQEDGEGALDSVIRDGTAKRDSLITDQLRTIAAGNVRPAFGQKSRTARAGTYDFDTFPTKTGASAAPLPRDPFALPSEK